MATSAMTFYGLILAKSKDEKIPENMAIDKDGNPTVDPAEAMSGAILPFDRGYKGSGLGMVVEMIAGPLASSAYCDYETYDKEWGSTFIAIDPELLVDIDKFKADSSDLISKVKNARRKAGVDSIRIPGERAASDYKTAIENGVVDVEDVILKQLGYI
jgi:LDH2 family malate/lactate/ureidoglycolate dehydrogenase